MSSPFTRKAAPANPRRRQDFRTRPVLYIIEAPVEEDEDPLDDPLRPLNLWTPYPGKRTYH